MVVQVHICTIIQNLHTCSVDTTCKDCTACNIRTCTDVHVCVCMPMALFSCICMYIHVPVKCTRESY